MRVRIVKDHKQYKKGETIQASPNVAFGLLDSGVGVISKDIRVDDYSTTSKFEVRKFKRKRQ